MEPTADQAQKEFQQAFYDRATPDEKQQIDEGNVPGRLGTWLRKVGKPNGQGPYKDGRDITVADWQAATALLVGGATEAPDHDIVGAAPAVAEVKTAVDTPLPSASSASAPDNPASGSASTGGGADAGPAPVPVPMPLAQQQADQAAAAAAQVTTRAVPEHHVSRIHVALDHLESEIGTHLSTWGKAALAEIRKLLPKA